MVLETPLHDAASRYTEHVFADAPTLAQALAASVAAQLRDAIAARGRALIAVSGGTTPRRFLQALSAAPLDWPAVIVTLCDERWVPPGEPRSNAHLVRETLLQGDAAAARFVPLYSDAATPEAGLAAVEERVAALPLPLDVVVLGMGNDAHTASLFPDADRLGPALDPHSPHHVLPMRALAAGEPRITLTLPVLAAARRAYLLFEGRKKKAVFDRVVSAGDILARSPMRAVIEHMQAPLAVYRCE